jgi:hypothetical protein
MVHMICMLDKQGYMDARACISLFARAHARARTHTFTHKYVILIAFQGQQLFRKRALMLRYTYIACHVKFIVLSCYYKSTLCNVPFENPLQMKLKIYIFYFGLLNIIPWRLLSTAKHKARYNLKPFSYLNLPLAGTKAFLALPETQVSVAFSYIFSVTRVYLWAGIAQSV